jgi:hypothetical protein
MTLLPLSPNWRRGKYSIVVIGLVLGIGIISATVMLGVWERRDSCAAGSLWNGTKCSLISEIHQRCQSLPPSQRKLCADILQKRVELLANYSRSRRFSREEQRSIERRVYAEAVRTLTVTAKFATTQTHLICKGRDDGRITCVSLASLLAFYDHHMVEQILADINRLRGASGLRDTDNVLVGCSNSAWTSLTTTKLSSTATASTNLTEEDDKAIFSACNTAGSAGGRSGSLATGSGFSGVTGINPMADACWAKGSAMGIAEFTEKAMDYAEEMGKRCEVTLAGSLMEGSGNSAGTGSSGGGSAGGTTNKKEVVVNNGDGTETVTTTDSNGNKTEYVRYDANNDDGGAGGSAFRGTTGGATKRIETEYRSDGSKVENKSSNADGSGIRRQKVTNADGEWMEITVLPSGLSIYRDSSGGHGMGGFGFSSDWGYDCIDEACSSCRDLAKFIPTLAEACDGADLETCRRFASASSCCGNPSAYPADPRVVTPNPVGDFVCVGPEAVDKQKGRCDQTCKVAGSVSSVDQDCYSTCMQSRESPFKWDLLDAICLYAYSEQCFSSDKGARDTVPIGYNPFPIPYHITSHTLLQLNRGDDFRSFPPSRR